MLSTNRLAVFVSMTFAAPAGAAVHVCRPGGNVQIQACLHSAVAGDEVAFAPGVYPIDPGSPPVLLVDRGGLTLRALSPADPPLFQCATGGAGRQNATQPFFSAFTVLVTSGATLPSVKFIDLRFAGCPTAIGVRPVSAAGGAFAEVEIRRVTIDDAILGIALLGVMRATVEDNLIRGTDFGIFIRGAAPRAQWVSVQRNELRGPCADLPPDVSCESVPIREQNVGAQIVNARYGLIAGNEVTGYVRTFPVGVTPNVGGRGLLVGDLARGSFDVDITHNVVHGNATSIGLGGGFGLGEADGEVTCNEIRDSSRFGIALVQNANGWRIHGNEIRTSAWADVFLIGPLGSLPANHGDRAIYQDPGNPTHHNEVIVPPGAVVQDEGIDNVVTFEEQRCADGLSDP
jgi:hypothetical protein